MGKYNKRKLSLIYDKKQKDFIVKYPRRCDGSLVLYHLLNDILRFELTKWHDGQIPYESYNFKNDLEKRGYDLSTLKFSIELKSETVTELK